MAKAFEFPAKQELTFPERCVCCGKPGETDMPMKVHRLKKEVALRIPLCLRCKRSDQRVFLFSLLSFLLGALVVGVGCFALLFIWEGKNGILAFLGFNNVSGQHDPLFVLFGGTAFLVGIAAGFLLEAAAKVLFIPFLGRALYYAPIMAVQILGDVEYVAGLRANLSKNMKTLHLKFYNDDVADEFAQLNH